MKILHINTDDISGGAARATNRLHNALKDNGINSYMLVRKKKSDDPTIYGPQSFFEKVWGMLRPLIEKIVLLSYRHRDKLPWSSSWLWNRNLIKKIKKINPDIVHLHWINAGFVRIEQLRKIKKPIVWTMHDMWPFTGGCHYSADCERYKTSCFKCPQLHAKRKRDLSSRVWKRKKKAYSKLDLNIISPSRWLANCASQSSLLKNANIHTLFNCLDANLYKPLSKVFVRKVLNLPKDKKIILFGAMSATSDKRKGFVHLKKALELLAKDKSVSNSDLLIVIFGASYSKDIEHLPFKVDFLGSLQDEYSLVLAYNAADVFVGPSLEDNLPNTFLEALPCGTPCVGFNIGGIPDMVQHKVNGYLAKPFVAKDLARGIKFCLNNPILGKNAIKISKDQYTYKVQAKKHLELYKKIIKEDS